MFRLGRPPAEDTHGRLEVMDAGSREENCLGLQHPVREEPDHEPAEGQRLAQLDPPDAIEGDRSEGTGRPRLMRVSRHQ
jgi:hypothetical protein